MKWKIKDREFISCVRAISRSSNMSIFFVHVWDVIGRGKVLNLVRIVAKLLFYISRYLNHGNNSKAEHFLKASFCLLSGLI
jgi:hypothetical protein